MVLHVTAELCTAGVPVRVLGVVVLAGVLHAGWNAAAHSISDRLAGQVAIAAAYTLVDAVGVRHSASVAGYVGWMFSGASRSPARDRAGSQEVSGTGRTFPPSIASASRSTMTLTRSLGNATASAQ